MTKRFQILAQPKFAGNTAKQRAWIEIDGFGRWQGLAVWVVAEPGEAVKRIGLRIPADWIVIENANNLHHLNTPRASNQCVEKRPHSLPTTRVTICANLEVGAAAAA